MNAPGPEGAPAYRRQARTMKIVRAFWLGLRLRSPFRLGSGGYGNFLRRRTLPNDDTGILTVGRNLFST